MTNFKYFKNLDFFDVNQIWLFSRGIIVTEYNCIKFSVFNRLSNDIKNRLIGQVDKKLGYFRLSSDVNSYDGAPLLDGDQFLSGRIVRIGYVQIGYCTRRVTVNGKIISVKSQT